METWIPDPWLSVIVEKDGMRFVVDLTQHERPGRCYQAASMNRSGLNGGD